MKNKRILAGPYLLWSVSFVVIPLLVIVYYAFTTDEGSQQRTQTRKDTVLPEDVYSSMFTASSSSDSGFFIVWISKGST